MIPRIAIALGGVQTSTFQQALRERLETEGVGLDKVIDCLKGVLSNQRRSIVPVSSAL